MSLCAVRVTNKWAIHANVSAYLQWCLFLPDAWIMYSNCTIATYFPILQSSKSPSTSSTHLHQMWVSGHQTTDQLLQWPSHVRWRVQMEQWATSGHLHAVHALFLDKLHAQSVSWNSLFSTDAGVHTCTVITEDFTVCHNYVCNPWSDDKLWNFKNIFRSRRLCCKWWPKSDVPSD